MLKVSCLLVSVDWDDPIVRSYRGCILSCGDRVLGQSCTGHFATDYQAIHKLAIRIRRGDVLCLADSVFQYKTEEAKNKLKRTRFHNQQDGGLNNGSKRDKSQETDESRTSPSEAFGNPEEDCESFEPEDEGDED
jgi:hypothetical protein